MRVFVDTNVLLDMICQREGFKEDADTIFRYCIEDKLKIVMSALTLINANYTAHKYGYSWDELLEVLKRLSDFYSDNWWMSMNFGFISFHKPCFAAFFIL